MRKDDLKRRMERNGLNDKTRAAKGGGIVVKMMKNMVRKYDKCDITLLGGRRYSLVNSPLPPLHGLLIVT